MIETITHLIWMLVSLMWLGVSFFALAIIGKVFLTLNEWIEQNFGVEEIEGAGEIKH